MDNRNDTPYLKELQMVDVQPVFILGVHRSGTSILYKMLTATGCFNPVIAYHLISYDQLLVNHHEGKDQIAKQELTNSLRKKGLTDRGIDQLKITADFAEEYGFLLGARTGQMRVTKKNIALFTELCKKITYMSGEKKPILLKNPYDFPNFLFLKEMFPTARFVFIHRHPQKTISSTLQAIRTLLKEKNLYTARLSKTYNRWYSNPLLLLPLRFIFRFFAEGCVVFLIWYTKRSIKYYLKNVKCLQKNEFISITYEELCDHPQETVENILATFQITRETSVDVTGMMKPRQVKSDPAVHTLRFSIKKSLKQYYDLFQYSIDN